jgi:histidine triad (HIT) family protein
MIRQRSHITQSEWVGGFCGFPQPLNSFYRRKKMSQDCIFCKIANGELGGPPLFQNERVTAFRDINPQAPTHILIIPNQHLASLDAASIADQALLGELMLKAAELALQEGVANQGYRVVLNTGRQGGQTVFHLHLHLLAGRPMHWPPG